ncbi:alcohol oxidase [Cryphonectria parasitica EP155]|uniref:Alcohol oxidase n=1 Tax=Cryphonectria parasitica (strain ATCC 38755 / EP155) TaxID=660469 RepID=A0A9P4XY80_CRYP1|nr:alcohol oxidase [Cryphonectria parasitica EP155]KAF3763109.1 alcohol oxidase [Cryphonectria parasitica EP155]
MLFSCPSLSLAAAVLLLLGPARAEGSYDYIIIGGGTSGLLLATLLSTNPNTTIAVLESGPDARTDPRITIPENEGTIVATTYDWNFTSIPQTSLLDQAVIAYPRGRVLGGTAAMNFMLWHRASSVELNAWEDVLNVSGGWDWDALFAASRDGETFMPPPEDLEAEGLTWDAAFHGFEGPVAGSMARNVYSLYEDYVVPSLEALGVPKLVDVDGGNTTGMRYGPLAVNASSYTRSYSGSAYTNVESRPNLVVYTNTTATRILWSDNDDDDDESFSSDDELAIASAVEFIDPSSGNLAILNGTNIIVSAGSIQSPPLLEVSGIGDPDILSSLGIPTIVVDLPAVGSGFQDHLTYAGIFGYNTSLNLTGDQYIQDFQDYAQPSRFLSEEDYAFASNLLFNNDSMNSLTGASNASLAMLRAMWTADQPLIEFGWFLGFVTGYVLHPLSSGSVHAAAGAAAQQPLIDPNFNGASINGTSFDLWLLAKALQYYATTVASSGPLGANGAEFSIPGTLSFEDFQAEVLEGLTSGSHPTGGCVMMPREQGGVVDGSLRVYGTANVRVVDASVIPSSPGQHAMGLVYAIAVRAAEILQGDAAY